MYFKIINSGVYIYLLLFFRIVFFNTPVKVFGHSWEDYYSWDSPPSR